ncbi:hypothetical protein OROMI_014575 [Orobanche minor]
MRLVAGTPEVPKCSAGENTGVACSIGDDGGEGGGGSAVVVVGVELDSRSRELLTWALVKVAQSGDRVIALHILDPNTEKSSLLSLVKTFDSMLAAYEGFCNLKQVDLELKICKGYHLRKILLRETESCGALSLILGTSGVRHKIRSRISVAKYCANNLQKNISVICVDNGKIVFRRESNASTLSLFGSLDKSGKSHLSRPPLRLSSSCSSRSENISMALVPLKTQERTESRSRWAALMRVLLHRRRATENLRSTNKSSPTTWKFKLPGQQSIAPIYPDQKQTTLDRNISRFDLVPQESGAVVLHSATNNFIHENLIGKGGTSKVYRGCLPGGNEVAVKILKNTSEDVLKHFVSEIEIITSLHHKNILSLVGFCFEEENLLLVYNLLSRGSLEDNLHGGENSGDLFGWEERYKVALGVADALHHLHNSAEPIIHRDVKSSNILLSDTFEPQLSDFGLATWALGCSHNVGTSDVAGTFGYLAPEYIMHGKLTEKLDVYAFGVVLLELLSGRRPIYNGSAKGQESLVMWAKHIFKEDLKTSELQDPKLVNSFNHEQFEIMVLAATLCIRHAPQSRPDISLVRKLLQGDPEVIEWARRESKTFSEDFNVINGEQSATNIQSFINMALCNLEEDSASTSSTEQNISVEDYLRGRLSRSSGYD